MGKRAPDPFGPKPADQWARRNCRPQFSRGGWSTQEAYAELKVEVENSNARRTSTPSALARSFGGQSRAVTLDTERTPAKHILSYCQVDRDVQERGEMKCSANDQESTSSP